MEDFVDENISGSTPLSERPSGAKLLAAIQQGDTVVVARLDRLFRSMVDTVNTMDDWGKRGVILVSLAESIDFSTPWGNAILHILAAIAELERSMIRERTRAALQAKRSRGEKLGNPPYGWCWLKGHGMIMNDKEQAIIKEIKLCHDAGMKQERIAGKLNQAGVSPRCGLRWRQPGIAKILRDNRNDS